MNSTTKPVAAGDTVATKPACYWCGETHGRRCPSILAIEYYPDGAYKRVEFVMPEDRNQ